MACRLFHRFWQAFLQLNLYETSSTDNRSVIQERLATRIYLISLFIVLLTVSIIAVFVDRTVDRIEYAPSAMRFSELANHYPNTLNCPCSNFAIAYKTFVSADVTFHPICSSSFIEQTWIDTILVLQNHTSSSFNDFRVTLSFFWQIISGFCLVSKRTWIETKTNFAVSRLLSTTAVAEATVRSQVQAALNTHLASAQIALAHNLLVIRRTISGNQIVSGAGTNFYLHYPSADMHVSWDSPRLSPRVFPNCSCLNGDGCSRLASVKTSNGSDAFIPGMRADCLIIDSALASTLECYYDAECLFLLHGRLPIPTTPLSKLFSGKHFAVQSTIQAIYNEMMIEEIITEIRFDSFYSQCDPKFCTYSYTHRFDVLFVLTTIIGIFGGLSFILRFSAPFVATMILRWKNRAKKNGATAPVVPFEQNRGK